MKVSIRSQWNYKEVRIASIWYKSNFFTPSFIFCISSLMLFNWEGNRCKMRFDLMTPPQPLQHVPTFAAVGTQTCARGQARKIKGTYISGGDFFFFLLKNPYCLGIPLYWNSRPGMTVPRAASSAVGLFTPQKWVSKLHDERQESPPEAETGDRMRCSLMKCLHLKKNHRSPMFLRHCQQKYPSSRHTTLQMTQRAASWAFPPLCNELIELSQQPLRCRERYSHTPPPAQWG